MKHFFQLEPKTFPLEEGPLMQVAWWCAICDDIMAEEIRKAEDADPWGTTAYTRR